MLFTTRIRSRSGTARGSRATTRCVVLLAVVTTLGCGGKTGGAQPGDASGEQSVDSGSPTDSGTPEDAWGVPADGGPWSPACPETVPTIGSPCTSSNVQCEYGAAWWNVSCDTVLRCISGAWENAQPGTNPCLPAPGPNESSCPENAGTIQNETVCPQAGLTCWYGDGANCVCQTQSQGAANKPLWFCTPEPGCPSSRPPLGAGCGEFAVVPILRLFR